MKNILLPTDFSSKARHAFGYATHFFQGREAKFTLLHAHSLDYQPTEIRMAALQHRIRRDANQRLRTELMAIRRRKCYQHLQINVQSEFGTPGMVIDAVTRAQPVDCLVIGTRSDDYVKKIYARTYAADALPKVNCPILLVPEGVPLTRPENIVAFADSSTRHRGAFSAQLRSLPGHLHANVQILDLPAQQEVSWQKEFRSSLHSGFGGLSILPSLFKKKGPARDIGQMLSFHQPDLLVLPKPFTGGSSSLPRLHWQSPIPVLLLP